MTAPGPRTIAGLCVVILVGCAEPRDPCSDPCRIGLEQVITLGSDAMKSPAALSSAPRMSRDSRGRFYIVSSERTGEVPLVLDSTGSFIDRIGRVGNGPGEFQNPAAILVTAGDTLHVLDGGTRRITVLDSGHRAIDWIPLSRFVYADQLIRLPDGTYVLNGRESALLRLDPTGELIDRLGERADPARRRARPYTTGRVLASSGNGGFWAARRYYRHEITLWDRQGREVRTLDPSASWYSPYDSLAMPSPERPPFWSIRGMWEDDRGRLWVLGSVADPQWSEGLGERVRAEGREFYSIRNYPAVFDLMIEVLDPETGERLSWRRVDEPRTTVVEPGLVASLRESPMGWWFADILRVRWDE